MKYKISIIVPVYNAEQYLVKCIESLVNQTLKEIEIILVDDGSTDRSGLICDEYGIKYKNINVIHKKNNGLGMARNSGIDVSNGEYIGFVDSDDYVSPSMAELLYSNAKKYDADISYGDFIRFFSEQDIYSINEKEYIEKIYIGDDISDYLVSRIGNNPEKIDDMLYEPIVCDGIFRRELFIENNIRFVSERKIISEDIIFDIDFIRHCKVIVHSNEIVYFYRYNPKSLTTKYIPDRFDKNIKLYYEMQKRVEGFIDTELAMLAMDRYFLSFSRLAIIQEAIHLKKNGLHHAVFKVKEICENYELRTILKRYPYQKMPLKYSLYCWLQKNKCVYLLLCATYIVQLKKGKI